MRQNAKRRILRLVLNLTLTLIVATALGACAQRSLTETERDFLNSIHASALDTDPVVITKGALVGTIPLTRPPRPYLACRERIFPEETEQKIRTSIGGFAYNNSVQIARRYYLPDYLSGYPETLPLTQAMFLAHELTHVWQWQNRKITGYAPMRAANEHSVSDDPYLFDLDSARPFLEYPYEQQASLVEEFVCCRALDPDGARTERLHQLLVSNFPSLQRRSNPSTQSIAIPWADAETAGICS